jgi:AcrR family transcriptional regulator
MSEISEKRKLEKRKKIIRSAVDIISKKGIKKATMSEIARKASVGYAAIYGYFPAKEAIVCAWYEEQLDLSVQRLRAIAGFDEFSLQEKLQAFFETQLEIFLPDREFVDVTFWPAVVSSPRGDHYSGPIRSSFSRIIADLFEAAIHIDEIPDQVLLKEIYIFFWHFNTGLVLYWLKDSSNQFQNTTILLDKCLDLALPFFKAGIVNKVLDIVSFLLKNHLVGCLDIVKDPMEVIHKVQSQFMGEKHA